jgi:hypothetical protein
VMPSAVMVPRTSHGFIETGYRIGLRTSFGDMSPPAGRG